MSEKLRNNTGEGELDSGTSARYASDRSELAQEVISQKADFVERWALTIFLFILLLLFGVSWFIKYPDIITANATLTARNAPKEIIPRQDGRLVKLFVHNNEQLTKNQLIGWIESTASHQEVFELSNQIDSTVKFLNLNRLFNVPNMINKHYENLGEVQQSYQQFITAWQQFDDYMINGFYQKKRALLQSNISSLKQTQQSIVRQRSLTIQDVKLAEETFEMNKKLFDEKVLTKEEFRTQGSRYINKQIAIPQLDASLLANESQSREQLKAIDQLDHDLAQQKVIFMQTLQSLKSIVDEWIKKHVLQSPIDGKVFFVIPLQENQFIRSGSLLGYVNPNDSHYFAEAYLAQTNFGKLNSGLSVQLRFDAYPYQETGFVEGKLDYISGVPSDSGFLATIRLDNGLRTVNRKLIPYKSGLKAKAIIITKDMTLAQRLYYNLSSSISLTTN